MICSLLLEWGASVPEDDPHMRRLDGRLIDQFRGLLVAFVTVSVAP
jgi:hypothetical protein